MASIPPSHLGQLPSVVNGDITCTGTVRSNNFQSSQINLTIPTSTSGVTCGALGLTSKTGALLLTIRADAVNYVSALLYVINASAISCVTLASGGGVSIDTDEVNILLTNSGAPLNATISTVWL